MKFRKYLFILINVIIVLLVLTSYKESRKFVDPLDERFIPGEVKNMEEMTVDLAYESILSPNSVKEVENAVKAMPADVIKSFVREGWKISVTQSIRIPEKEQLLYEQGAIAGLCDFDRKVIQIKIIDEANEDITGSYYIRTIHELSHYADYVYGNISESDGFQRLFKQHQKDYIEYEYAGMERDQSTALQMDYATSNAGEFFACGLKDYLANSDYLRENYVNMYVFFRNMIDKGV